MRLASILGFPYLTRRGDILPSSYVVASDTKPSPHVILLNDVEELRGAGLRLSRLPYKGIHLVVAEAQIQGGTFQEQAGGIPSMTPPFMELAQTSSIDGRMPPVVTANKIITVASITEDIARLSGDEEGEAILNASSEDGGMEIVVRTGDAVEGGGIGEVLDEIYYDMQVENSMRGGYIRFAPIIVRAGGRLYTAAPVYLDLLAKRSGNIKVAEYRELEIGRILTYVIELESERLPVMRPKDIVEALERDVVSL